MKQRCIAVALRTGKRCKKSAQSGLGAYCIFHNKDISVIFDRVIINIITKIDDCIHTSLEVDLAVYEEIFFSNKLSYENVESAVQEKIKHEKR